MSETFDLRLDGLITLLSPLSHIGESIGPDSYLSQDVIIGPDGRPVECFVYSGNAFRGILRDMATIYMSETMNANLGEGTVQYPLGVFYLLFSGGSLGGKQSVDIDQARAYRRNVPMLSVFGGGVGNQILTGKISIGAMYPLVAECQRVLPSHLRNLAAPSWTEWTFDKSFTRMDDAKNEERRKYLIDDDKPALPGAQEQLTIEGATKSKETKKKEEKPQQMRYSVELLAAGAQLYQRIDIRDMTTLELGAFVSALAQFARHPYIGGKSGTGHGLVEIEYQWRPAGDGEAKGKFLSLGSGGLWLSKPADDAREVYDDYLQLQYDKYVEQNAVELQQLLAPGFSPGAVSK